MNFTRTQITLLTLLSLCGCASPTPDASSASPEPEVPSTTFPQGEESICLAYLMELRASPEASAAGIIYSASDPSLPEGYLPPVPVFRPPPNYPPSAIQNGNGGRVVMGSIIEVNGTVSHARVLRSSGSRGLFDDEALSTLQKWGYDPARLDGEYVRSYMCNQISFNIVG